MGVGCSEVACCVHKVCTDVPYKVARFVAASRFGNVVSLLRDKSLLV